MADCHLSRRCPAHTDICTSPTTQEGWGQGLPAALLVPYEQGSLLSPRNLKFVLKELIWVAR